MNRRSKTLQISGVIVLIATAIIIALCIEDWNGITPFAVIFLVFAEIVFFGGLMLVEKFAEQTEQIVVRSSYVAVISIYSCIAFALSLVFLAKFKHEWTVFIIMQLIALVIMAILLLIFYSIGKGVSISNEKTMNIVGQTNSYVNRLNIIMAFDTAKSYALTIKKLSDDLRFSDTSTIVSSDTEIDRVISEIELEFSKDMVSQSEELIRKKFTELNSLIKKRKIEVSSIKKGRI